MSEQGSRRGYASPRLARGLATLTLGIGLAYALGAENPRLMLTDALRPTSTAYLETDASSAVLRAWDATLAEQLLSRAAYAVSGICVGLGALLLRQLLLSIAEGRPFRSGNPARIAGIGGLVLVAGVAWMVLPAAATSLVISRLDLPPFTLGAQVMLDFRPLLGALLALVLAEAFRRGGLLARDADGLV